MYISKIISAIFLWQVR